MKPLWLGLGATVLLLLSCSGDVGELPLYEDIDAAGTHEDGDVGSVSQGETFIVPPGSVACDRSTKPTNLPLIVYYGFFRDDDGTISDALNSRLVIPGLEVVFATRWPTVMEPGDSRVCGAPSPTFDKWKKKGARLGYALPIAMLGKWLDGGVPAAADQIEKLFKDGWDYAVLDEIRGLDWWDTGKYGSQLPALLAELAARNQDKKMIIFFSPGSTDVARPANQDGGLVRFRSLMQSCQQRCRKMVFETYPSNTLTVPAEQSIVTTSVTSGATSNAKMIEQLATRLSRVAPGTNVAGISALGLGNVTGDKVGLNYLNDPECDVAPLVGACKANGSGLGSLRLQFGALHGGTYAKNQRGVAFYSPGKVVTVPGNRWSKDDLSRHLAGLTAWWVGK